MARARMTGPIDLFTFEREAKVVKSTRIIWALFAIIGIGLTWSYFARLDEVASGSGRVVPTMRDQIVQSLEGGILTKINVREDQVVEAGEILAQLDPTQSEANAGESSARYRAALASAARLRSEVDGVELSFPDELQDYPELIAAETNLYTSRKTRLDETVRKTLETKDLVQVELDIHSRLSSLGAASNVEVLRLQRQVSELELRLDDVKSQYIVEAREALAKANSEVDALASVMAGRSDSVTRLTIRSPVRGVVKNIEISTIGGVISPNGKLMDIIPLGDEMVIEARIQPQDIAYIHKGQRASIKLSAYDSSIFGSLEGSVTSISPDTMKDEVNPAIHYYRVFVTADEDAIKNKNGEQFPITPGMVATVDVHTGSKTVWEYLTKPLNKAAEALRER